MKVEDLVVLINDVEIMPMKYETPLHEDHDGPFVSWIPGIGWVEHDYKITETCTEGGDGEFTRRCVLE